MRGLIGSRRFRVAATAALAAAAVGGYARSSAAAPEAAVPCSVSSLISAISTANTTPADSSITLTSGCVYNLTAANNATDGGTGLPVITGHVSVTGSATISRSGASGTTAFRIFDVGSGGSLTLNSVTLSNGLADDGINGGGAVLNRGSLTVTKSTFSGNSSPAATGTSGGAINTLGPLTVSLSTFSGNTAQEGGAIFNQSTTAAATVTDSTFAGNTATIFGGGALVSAQGTTNLARDTFSQNNATGTAGGGAIDNDAIVNVTDSTFAGNTGGTNGGGAVQNFGTATISWSTLSGNSSPFGANLHNFTGATLTVSDSIVANAQGGGTNCSGPVAVVDGGYNIDDANSCGFATANHSQINTNPNLGALASNGGPTQTMALPANSPAVDAVPVTVAGCAKSTDQRGESRPQGPACDIGAYELYKAPPPPPPPTGPIKGFDGKCVDDYHGGTTNGTKVDLYTCNGTVAQRWVAASGELRVKGKCLSDTGTGGNGTKVELYTCNGAKNQIWTHKSNGEYVLKLNGLCLDDPKSSKVNGTRLDIWHCVATAANERWSLP